MRRAGPHPDLHLHQPLGGEGDHLAQEVGVGGLLHQPAKVHHLVGHRRFLGLRLRFTTRTYRKIDDDHRKPLARYSAMESALRGGLLECGYTANRDTISSCPQHFLHEFQNLCYSVAFSPRGSGERSRKES